MSEEPTSTRQGIITLPQWIELSTREDTLGDLIHRLVPNGSLVTRTALAQLLECTSIVDPHKITELVGRERLLKMKKIAPTIVDGHFRADKIEEVREELMALIRRKERGGKALKEMKDIKTYMILQAHLALLSLLVAEGQLWPFFMACDKNTASGKKRRPFQETSDDIGKTNFGEY